MLFKIIVFLLSPFINSYEETQAHTTVYLSGAAYCGKDNYDTMLLAGPASGFVYTDTLYDVKTDLQGYIGYIPAKKSIYVVVRGSSSILNWIDDLEVKLVDYVSWPICNCNVIMMLVSVALDFTVILKEERLLAFDLELMV
jgi:hypothetical protein